MKNSQIKNKQTMEFLRFDCWNIAGWMDEGLSE
jgi:hypothetical protein